MAVATAGVLSVTLRADDKASMPLVRLGTSADRLALRMTRLGERVRGLGSLSRLSNGARSVTRSLEGIVPPLSVLTAAGTLAGITALATRFASFGAELGRTAYRVQASVAQLHALQGAARLSGSSAEAMTQTLEGLGDALLDATAGRDVNAAMYFSQLGISMRDAATGGARLAKDVLPEVADQIARIKDPRIQANVMAALRIPASALPFLRQGAAGLRDYQREARDYGVVTANGAEIARRFELAQARLSLATDGLGKAIGERLAPYIGGILESMAGWIRVNRDWVATKLDEGVRWLTEAVIGAYEAVKKWAGDGGWQRLTASLGSIGRAAGSIFGADSDSMTGIERWVKRIDDVVKKVDEWQRSLERLQRNPLMRWWFDMDPEKVAAPGAAGGANAAPSNWQLPTRLVDDVLRQPWRDVTKQGQPRGIRNNNPLNLTYVPGQTGLDPAQPSDGRFGRYGSMEEGVAQSVRQMQIHFDRRGDDTLAKMITRWAPPSENDTAGYIARVSKETGIEPGAPLNVRDFETLRRMVASMARMENGVPIDQGAVDKGVRIALGQPVAPGPTVAAPGGGLRLPPIATLPPPGAPPAAPGGQAPAATPPAAGGQPAATRQAVDVRVRLEGAGTQGATITTRGPDGSIRVERSMQEGFGG